MSERPWLLAVETVGRSGSACLVDRSGRLLADSDLEGEPSEIALVAVLDRLVRERGAPEALAIANGPGSFTGLRVGVIATRTWAWLEALPVHPVDSLVALALERGDGLWWCLLPLKRDTTFHAVIEVRSGRPMVLRPSIAQADALAPDLPGQMTDLVAIGPALTLKPGLVDAWRPGTRTGDPAGPTARGVALAARHVEPVSWDHVLPAYLQEPGPVLQRRERSS